MTMLPPDPVYIFKGDMDSVSCISFKITPTHECIYAGTVAGVVHVWNLKTKRETKAVKISEDSCISVQPTGDDIVVTHDKTGCVSFWKESQDSWSLLNQVKTDFFGFCKFFSFENSIYLPVKESKFEIFSLKTHEVVDKMVFPDTSKLGEVMSFKVFTLFNQKLMIVAYEGKKVILWDRESLQKVSEMDLENCPMTVDFDEKTCKGICGDPSETMVVFAIDKELALKEIKRVTLTNAGVAAVKIRADSKLVGVGCWDGRLRLYSWKTFVLLAALDIHSSTVQDVSFGDGWKDRDGRIKVLLAAGSKDGSISLWDLYN